MTQSIHGSDETSYVDIEGLPLNEYLSACLATLEFPTLFSDQKGDLRQEKSNLVFRNADVKKNIFFNFSF